MQFRDLSIGQPFRFERELSGSLVGIKTGEAVKSGRKKYRFVKDGMECRVGSIRADVVPVTLPSSISNEDGARNEEHLLTWQETVRGWTGNESWRT
jgi:hypothetical protein